ncbi:hypothetical protein REPUB_Repub03eG0179500 [Reevesia pubescens]
MEAHNNVCASAIVAEVLKGVENYPQWRVCIRTYLLARDLWDVVEETSEPPTDDSNWMKRNWSALHAIQISCSPTILSYIIDQTTATDAWNTLADICQPPPMPAEDAPMPAEQEPTPAEEEPTQPVMEVVERTVTLEFLKAIKESDKQTINRLLKEIPHLMNAEIFQDMGHGLLHFSIKIGSLEMIDEFLGYMSEEDVKTQDYRGRTALHFAAMSPGNAKIAQSLITKNKDLLTIPNDEGLIPLFYACRRGYKDISHCLYNMTTREYLLSPENNGTHPAVIVRCCVESKLFDIALDLLRRCPELTVASKNDHGRNAVLSLSRRPSAFLSSSRLSFLQHMIYFCLKVKQSKPLSSDDDVCINTNEQQDQKETKTFMMQVEGKLLGLWSNLLTFFGIKQIYDLKQTHVDANEILRLMSKEITTLDEEQISQSSVDKAIINASQRGMVEFIVEIIKNNPDLFDVYDEDYRSIFEIAVAYRHEKLFSLIYGHEAMKYDFNNYIDKYVNNMLHLAGQVTEESQLKLDQISGAALQMQRELQWFKEVESIVPPAYKEDTNVQGETPYEAFDRSHAELLKKGEQWMKDIAQSSSIVGTLIIAIMFAALFTVPGGTNQDTGIPLHLNKKIFKVFIVSDAVSLFASSTSVLISVGILTSRYSKDDFLTSLPRRLIMGLSALFISIATMMVSFCSASIIMLKGQLEITIPIGLLAAIPVCLFVRFQFPLLLKIFISTYGPGIFDRKMKKWL